MKTLSISSLLEQESQSPSEEKLLTELNKLPISKQLKQALTEILTTIHKISPFNLEEDPLKVGMNTLGDVKYSFPKPKTILQLLQVSELVIDNEKYPNGKAEVQTARQALALDTLNTIPEPSTEEASAEIMADLALFLNKFSAYYYVENGGMFIYDYKKKCRVKRSRAYDKQKVFPVPQEHAAQVLKKSLQAIQTSFASNLRDYFLVINRYYAIARFFRPEYGKEKPSIPSGTETLLAKILDEIKSNHPLITNDRIFRDFSKPQNTPQPEATIATTTEATMQRIAAAVPGTNIVFSGPGVEQVLASKEILEIPNPAELYSTYQNAYSSLTRET